jgi:hypothetical protein
VFAGLITALQMNSEAHLEKFPRKSAETNRANRMHNLTSCLLSAHFHLHHTALDRTP